MKDKQKDKQKEQFRHLRSMERSLKFQKIFTAYGNKKRKYYSHPCCIADQFGGGGNE